MAFNLPPNGQGSPYQKQQSLLTRTEHHFYEVLQQAVPGYLHINMKVRLADLVTASPGLWDTQSHQNRIQQKHIDFVLVRRDNAAPVLVIELDDRSHERPKSQERDAFVDGVMQSVGLPILHIPTQTIHDPAMLAEQIQHAISAAGTQQFVYRPAATRGSRIKRRRRRASTESLELFLGCLGAYGMILGFLPGLALGSLGLIFLVVAGIAGLLTLWLDWKDGRSLVGSALFLFLTGALMFGTIYGIMWYFLHYLPSTGQPLFKFGPLPTRTPLP